MAHQLERGLELLEWCAQRTASQGFSAVQEAFPDLPKASLARLLKDLVTSGHLVKDQHGYRCGERLGIFAALRPPEPRQALIERWKPFLTWLAQRFECTAILLERVGDLPVCIERCLTEVSPWMQEIGFVNHHPEQIWRQALVAFAPELQPAFFRAHPKWKAGVLAYAAAGFALDDQTWKPGFRRLAFPVQDGLLGLGANVSQLTDRKLKDLIKTVKDTL